MTAKTGRKVLLLVALGGGLFLIGGVGPADSRSDSKSDVEEARPNPGSIGEVAVHALANLEPAGGVIVVGARPGARIEELKVKEGEEVKQGALLAILEGHEQAMVQRALAEAQKKSADHRRSLKREKLTLEREQYDQLKKKRLEDAQHLVKISRQRLQETTDLYKKMDDALKRDAKAKFDLDQTFFQMETATLKADLDLQELQAAQGLQPKQRALEDRNLADSGPDDDVLDRQIDLARLNETETEIHAPISGRVLEVLTHQGEVGSGPLLALGDLSAMVAKAEVYQSDVPRIGLGDRAEVKVLDKVIAGKVTAISRMVGKNELRSVDPRALQDLRVVKVTVALDDSAEASRAVHMQVDVTIRPNPVAGR